jgi:hypothetical protein
MDGTWEFKHGDQTLTLRKGDCIYFDASVPHSGRPIGNKPVKAFMVILFGGEQQVPPRGVSIGLWEKTTLAIWRYSQERNNEMGTFVIQFIHGLVYGLLLFLVASGLTLVFGMMSVLNIAHVSFYMLGAYLSYTMFKVVGNFWLALIVCPILVALLGILMERLILRRVHAAGHVQEFCHHLWHPFRPQ